jgi:hypothetical protein
MKRPILACLFAACIATASAVDKAAPVSPEGKFTGKVTETMDAASYTYVRIDTGKEKIWVAAPKVQVKVGDSVTVPSSMAMEKYHSKTLNRDFDVVYFAGDMQVNGKTAGESVPGLPKDHPPIPAAAAQQPKIDLSNIAKAKGGKTVAEIYADKSKLGGKEVTLRGKVVKYNANILGKNWIHLRDGSGTAPENDLLITSETPCKIGDTVVATGKLSLNKDFGSNYKYDVMVEDAKIVVEQGT